MFEQEEQGLLREGCERPRDHSRDRSQDLTPPHLIPSPERYATQ